MPMHPFYKEALSICFNNYIFAWQHINRAGIHCKAEPDARTENEQADDKSMALSG